MAVCADAVLIPEIPYDVTKVAAKLRARMQGGRRSGLVVVAEGAIPAASMQTETKTVDSMKASLSPGATGHTGAHVIDRSGHVAETVALQLQRLTDHETYPLVLGDLVKGGPPTAVDRQLGPGLRCRRRAWPARRSKWRHGDIPAAGSDVRAAGRGDQQGPDRSRRQRVHADCAVARDLFRRRGDAMTIQQCSQRRRPEHPALLHQRRPGYPHERVPQGLLAALQVVQQSGEHPPEAGTGVRPQEVHRRKRMRLVPEGMPGVRDLGHAVRRQGADRLGPVHQLRQMRARLPAGGTLPVRPGNDRGRGARRGRTGRQLLSRVRRGHHAVSGGECVLQCDFVAALLEEAHHRGINTAIETAGNYPGPSWKKCCRTSIRSCTTTS